MLQVANEVLEPNSYRQLEKWQAMIDAEVTFESRSTKAKSLWNKHSTLTFKNIKQRLSEMSPGYNRCVYCEDSFADEIEHIYPKDLFPNRSFSWENYIYACGPCNGPKSNKFSLIDENDDLKDITPVRNQPAQEPPDLPAALINPRSEDPMSFLWIDIFGSFVYAPIPDLSKANKNKALYTMEILGLNSRAYLVSSRRSAFHTYLALGNYYITLRDSASVDQSVLDEFKKNIKHQNWPSVWFEMKRKRTLIDELHELFTSAPELI